VDGINGLAVSMPVAGVVATLVAGPSVLAKLTPEILLIGIGLAVLLPVVPFALEMMSLRRAPGRCWASVWWSRPEWGRPAAAPGRRRRCPPKSARRLLN
jgi:threonine/homoserine efflux transporter RhtA